MVVHENYKPRPLKIYKKGETLNKPEDSKEVETEEK
jgi:hypothetical protein